jgi:hypothetical protein
MYNWDLMNISKRIVKISPKTQAFLQRTAGPQHAGVASSANNPMKLSHKSDPESVV